MHHTVAGCHASEKSGRNKDFSGEFCKMSGKFGYLAYVRELSGKFAIVI